MPGVSVSTNLNCYTIAEILTPGPSYPMTQYFKPSTCCTTLGDIVCDAAGFSDAMANALVGGNYRTYGYSCAGALGFGSKGSWTNAFRNVGGSSCITSACSHDHLCARHCIALQPQARNLILTAYNKVPRIIPRINVCIDHSTISAQHYAL